MKNELEFSRWFRQKLKDIIHFVSTQSLGNGAPDLLATHRVFGSMFLELKVIKDRDCKIKFEKAQPSWIADFITCGGKVGIVVYVQDTDETAVLDGRRIREIEKLTLNEMQEGRHIVEYMKKQNEMNKYCLAHLILFRCCFLWGPVEPVS